MDFPDVSDFLPDDARRDLRRFHATATTADKMLIDALVALRVAVAPGAQADEDLSLTVNTLDS